MQSVDLGLCLAGWILLHWAFLSRSMPLFNSGRIYLALSADTNFCQLNKLTEHAIGETSEGEYSFAVLLAAAFMGESTLGVAALFGMFITFVHPIWVYC